MNNVFKAVAITCGIALLSGSLAWSDDPKAKSKKEQEAFVEMQQKLSAAANDPTAQLKAIEDFLTAFADTQFKVLLLENAMHIAQQKRDVPLATTYAERVLEADPKDFEADVAIATMTAQGAKEFDLDKAEKTAKVQKYAQATIDNVKDYPKPISQIPDDQWAQQKTSAVAQAYISLGMMDLVNKKYDEAIKEFKSSYDTMPDPVTEFRLGEAYMKAKQYDDASAAFDKVLAMPDTPANVKTYAQQRKAEVAKMKAASSK